MNVQRHDYDSWHSLPEMLCDRAHHYADRPCMGIRRNDHWIWLNYGEVGARIRALASYLQELGLKPGERVALVSENRPEWVIADFAIMAAGGVSVPHYMNVTSEDHDHLLTDSGAIGVIASGEALKGTFGEALARLDKISQSLPFIIGLDPSPYAAHQAGEIFFQASHLLEKQDLISRGLDDLACLIYTSGTSDRPKGVMLSHGAILSNCRGAFDLLSDLGLGEETFLSFLPLAHAYEHTAGMIFPLSVGAAIAYSGGSDQLSADIVDICPSLMTAVPRFYEIMRRRIQTATVRKGKLASWLLKQSLRRGEQALLPQRYRLSYQLNPYHWVLGLILEKMVYKKVRRAFGGRLKALISGGAALNPQVNAFFNHLGVRLLQGYGQTEAAPIISCNRPGDIRFETTGVPFAGYEVRIAKDGEILVRGDSLMKGYWNNAQATQEAIQKGWLYTGDIGRIDPDGHLVITDRKKDILVLSGGETLSPQRIEESLTAEAEISQAFVDGSQHVVALIVPDADYAMEWVRARGQSEADLVTLINDEEFAHKIAAAVRRASLSSVEAIRRHALIAEPFSVANGLLTPTLKMRRNAVRTRYQTTLASLLGSSRASGDA